MIEDLIEGISCYCDTEKKMTALDNICYSFGDYFKSYPEMNTEDNNKFYDYAEKHKNDKDFIKKYIHPDKEYPAIAQMGRKKVNYGFHTYLAIPDNDNKEGADIIIDKRLNKGRVGLAAGGALAAGGLAAYLIYKHNKKKKLEAERAARLADEI
jgi:hypothetical protein